MVVTAGLKNIRLTASAIRIMLCLPLHLHCFVCYISINIEEMVLLFYYLENLVLIYEKPCFSF